MRRCYDGFAVFDVRLKTLQPVCTGALEAIETQDSFAREHTRSSLVGFERSVELPTFVRGVKIVRRDEDLKSKLLRGLEDALHIFNGVVFVKTLAELRPSQARFAQYFILRIDHYDCAVVLIEFHNHSFQIRLEAFRLWLSVFGACILSPVNATSGLREVKSRCCLPQKIFYFLIQIFSDLQRLVTPIRCQET